MEGSVCQSQDFWTSLFTLLSTPAHKGWPPSGVRWQLAVRAFLVFLGTLAPCHPISAGWEHSLHQVLPSSEDPRLPAPGWGGYDSQSEDGDRCRGSPSPLCIQRPGRHQDGSWQEQVPPERKNSPWSVDKRPLHAHNYSFQKKQEAGVDWQSHGRPEQSETIRSQPPAVVYFPVPETPFPAPFCLLLHFRVIFGWVVSGRR